MPLTSAFTPPGHFSFSSRPSHGESIYRALRDNFGSTFSVEGDSLQQARLYAQAMCLASAEYQLERAANNKTPSKATELLGVLEHDYQVVPTPKATLSERRAYLVAVQKVTRGNRREAIEDALRSLLGDDFIEYRTTAREDIVVSPDMHGSHAVFARSGAKKKVIRLDAPVQVRFASSTIPYTALGGTDAPLKGEEFCVDPDPHRATERITIADVTPTTLTAVFGQAHDAGTLAVRPHPLWISNQRVSTIVVSDARSRDPETRRKIHELMSRALRGVSRWQIITNLGGFETDDPVLGLTDSVPLF